MGCKTMKECFACYQKVRRESKWWYGTCQVTPCLEHIQPVTHNYIFQQCVFSDALLSIFHIDRFVFLICKFFCFYDGPIFKVEFYSYILCSTSYLHTLMKSSLFSAFMEDRPIKFTVIN